MCSYSLWGENCVLNQHLTGQLSPGPTPWPPSIYPPLPLVELIDQFPKSPALSQPSFCHASARVTPLPVAVGELARASPRSVLQRPFLVQPSWAKILSQIIFSALSPGWILTSTHYIFMENTANTTVNKKHIGGPSNEFSQGFSSWILTVNHRTKHFTYIISTTLYRWGKGGPGKLTPLLEVPWQKCHRGCHNEIDSIWKQTRDLSPYTPPILLRYHRQLTSYFTLMELCVISQDLW